MILYIYMAGVPVGIFCGAYCEYKEHNFLDIEMIFKATIIGLTLNWFSIPMLIFYSWHEWKYKIIIDKRKK